MEFTSSHKYFKNTTTKETDLTKHLLNCNRRPWTPNTTRKISMQFGRMKERKKEMTKDQQALWGTEVKRAASEKPTHSRGISWNRKEYSRNYRGT